MENSRTSRSRSALLRHPRRWRSRRTDPGRTARRRQLGAAAGQHHEQHLGTEPAGQPRRGQRAEQRGPDHHAVGETEHASTVVVRNGVLDRLGDRALDVHRGGPDHREHRQHPGHRRRERHHQRRRRPGRRGRRACGRAPTCRATRGADPRARPEAEHRRGRAEARVACAPHVGRERQQGQRDCRADGVEHGDDQQRREHGRRAADRAEGADRARPPAATGAAARPASGAAGRARSARRATTATRGRVAGGEQQPAERRPDHERRDLDGDQQVGGAARRSPAIPGIAAARAG